MFSPHYSLYSFYLLVLTSLISLSAVCPCNCQSPNFPTNPNNKRNLESSICIHSLPITVTLFTDSRHVMSWTGDHCPCSSPLSSVPDPRVSVTAAQLTPDGSCALQHNRSHANCCQNARSVEEQLWRDKKILIYSQINTVDTILTRFHYLDPSVPGPRF